jgi:hypothetical protein
LLSCFQNSFRLVCRQYICCLAHECPFECRRSSLRGRTRSLCLCWRCLFADFAKPPRADRSSAAPPGSHFRLAP